MADLPDWGIEIAKCVEINSNITNATIDVDANITNATIDVDATIQNASINTETNITNANINTNATIQNASINTETNIASSAVTIDTNITNATIDVEANITNANINVEADLVKSINITMHTSPNWLNLTQTEVIKQASLPEGNNAVGNVGLMPSCDVFSLSYDSDSTIIGSIQEYKDNLYCGSENLGEIYVYDGSTWGLEATHGVNCWNMIVFDGYLYHTNATDTNIWHFDGTTWVSVAAPAGETSLRALGIYEEALYVGSGNTGKVFTYDITDGFVEVYDSAATGISSFCTWNDKLFFSGSNDKTLYCFDGVDWFKKKIFSAGNINSLEVYNDKLFMGLDNGEIWSFDGIEWIKEIDLGAIEIYQLKTWYNTLYIASEWEGAILEYNGINFKEVITRSGKQTRAMNTYRNMLFLGIDYTGYIYKINRIESLATHQREPYNAIEVEGECPLLNFGTVTADWTEQDSGGAGLNFDRNFYITDIILILNTDPTTAAATQPIPVSFALYDDDGLVYIATVLLGIPNNTTIHFNTGIKMTKSTGWEGKTRLGGATNLDYDVYLNGYFDDY